MTLPQDETGRTLAHADRLLAAARWSEAADLYRAALERRPSHADAWFNLGYALRMSGRFDEAMAAYRQALEHRVLQPEIAHVNLAAILSDHLGRDAEAFAELQAALALAPTCAPALLNLGNLHEERGERIRAADCYRRLLGMGHEPADAMHCLAIARLLQLEPPASRDDPLLLRARGLAATDHLDSSGRATLLFAIGRTLDALNETRDAFAAFVEGNIRAHAGASPYVPEHSRSRSEALIAACDGGVSPTACQEMTPEPLFICGMFRSGSTLLEQVLCGHPDVAAAGELDLLPRIAMGPLSPYPASLARLDQARCTDLAAGYHAAMLARARICGPHRYITDKRPDNYQLIGLIKRLFPRAKILNTVRDPIDNGLSIFMQHLNPYAFRYAGSLADIGHHYGEYRRLIAHWKAVHPCDVFDFDYDAFVSDPEGTLRPLLDFLELPWHANCLAFHRLGNTVKSASYWQVRQPLYAEASGRWRRYREHLGPLLHALRAQGVAVPRD